MYSSPYQSTYTLGGSPLFLRALILSYMIILGTVNQTSPINLFFYFTPSSIIPSSCFIRVILVLSWPSAAISEYFKSSKQSAQLTTYHMSAFFCRASEKHFPSSSLSSFLKQSYRVSSDQLKNWSMQLVLRAIIWSMGLAAFIILPFEDVMFPLYTSNSLLSSNRNRILLRSQLNLCRIRTVSLSSAYPNCRVLCTAHRSQSSQITVLVYYSFFSIRFSIFYFMSLYSSPSIDLLGTTFQINQYNYCIVFLEELGVLIDEQRGRYFRAVPTLREVHSVTMGNSQLQAQGTIGKVYFILVCPH